MKFKSSNMILIERGADLSLSEDNSWFDGNLTYMTRPMIINEHCNLIWLSTVLYLIGLAKKANLYLQIKEHKA